MDFSPFVYDTTITAGQMNDNMHAIGEGNLLPRGGSDLAATTSIYNLGSETYKWKDVYCGGLELSGAKNYNTWNLVAQYNIGSFGMSSIEFTGLTASALYRIDLYLSQSIKTNTVHYIAMIFNGDSSASYNTEFFQGNLATVGVYAGSLTNFIHITRQTATAYPFCISEIIFSGYYNQNKCGFAQTMIQTDGGAITDVLYNYFGWMNNTDTITSIKFYPNNNGGDAGIFSTQGSIYLWRLD
jgi:hypothetical protein